MLVGGGGGGSRERIEGGFMSRPPTVKLAQKYLVLNLGQFRTKIENPENLGNCGRPVWP